jgi:hypothetical protein
MRLRSLLIALAALLAAAPAAGAAPLFASDNVELVDELPEATGAIGARFSRDGRTMFVTAASGLLVYDVSEPQAPRKLSQIPLPHFENEDVDLGHVAGRDIVVISNDPSFTGVGVLYVFDVTDPSNPQRIATHLTEAPLVGGLAGAEGTSNGHIANCIQDCRWLWTTGSSEGITVYDLSDPTNPRHMGAFTLPGNGFTHDVEVDDTGIAWVTGEDGTFGYDVRHMTDPLNPPLVYRSDDRVLNSGNSGPFSPGTANDYPLDFLHHNSRRLSSRVMAITEEDYTRPGCEGQGSLQTWKITDQRNADGTRRLVLLDMFTTELNELMNGTGRSNPYGAPTTVNCSAHWFDADRGLIAQGWYDQGVRFLDVSDPRDIQQVGYFVTEGTFWAAYFAPSDRSGQTVYGLDTAGGIDVLHIDRGRPRQRRQLSQSESESLLSRAATAAGRYVSDRRFGLACPLLASAARGVVAR